MRRRTHLDVRAVTHRIPRVQADRLLWPAHTVTTRDAPGRRGRVEEAASAQCSLARVPAALPRAPPAEGRPRARAGGRAGGPVPQPGARGRGAGAGQRVVHARGAAGLARGVQRAGLSGGGGRAHAAHAHAAAAAAPPGALGAPRLAPRRPRLRALARAALAVRCGLWRVSKACWRWARPADRCLAGPAAASAARARRAPSRRRAQAGVADIILRAVSWEAEVSLEGTLALLEALARDLQADFLPHLPRAMSALADVLDEGARCYRVQGRVGYEGARGPPPQRCAEPTGAALAAASVPHASTPPARRRRRLLEGVCGGGRCFCSCVRVCACTVRRPGCARPARCQHACRVPLLRCRPRTLSGFRGRAQAASGSRRWRGRCSPPRQAYAARCCARWQPTRRGCWPRPRGCAPRARPTCAAWLRRRSGQCCARRRRPPRARASAPRSPARPAPAHRGRLRSRCRSACLLRRPALLGALPRGRR